MYYEKPMCEFQFFSSKFIFNYISHYFIFKRLIHTERRNRNFLSVGSPLGGHYGQGWATSKPRVTSLSGSLILFQITFWNRPVFWIHFGIWSLLICKELCQIGIIKFICSGPPANTFYVSLKGAGLFHIWPHGMKETPKLSASADW